MTDPSHPSVVLVGPTHPFTGGISQHTTRLALELEARHVHVQVESWKHQYPSSLHPGRSRVPRDEPEIGIPQRVTEALTWYNPFSWWRCGRRSRDAGLIVLSVPTPFHAIPYAVMLLARGAHRPSLALVHNVEPHEPGPWDNKLMGWLLRKVDHVVVHSADQEQKARLLAGDTTRVHCARLPSPWPDVANNQSERATNAPTRLVFFGNVRPYKGLDRLLRAMEHVPGITLLVAGEFWGQEEYYRNLIDELHLRERVEILPGYVDHADMSDLFARSDVLVMPYRTGTGSIVGDLGLRHGLPVIVTDVGSIADAVHHEETGLVLPPDDDQALVSALHRAGSREVVARWRKNVRLRVNDQSSDWSIYCATILGA